MTTRATSTLLLAWAVGAMTGCSSHDEGSTGEGGQLTFNAGVASDAPLASLEPDDLDALCGELARLKTFSVEQSCTLRAATQAMDRADCETRAAECFEDRRAALEDANDLLTCRLKLEGDFTDCGDATVGEFEVCQTDSAIAGYGPLAGITCADAPVTMEDLAGAGAPDGEQPQSCAAIEAKCK